MKLVVEFIKTGNMVYISHLDLTRLFLRVLRMSGLRPAYSHGFNPHPKMSMALPLALGAHSFCELLEFDTAETASLQEVEEALLLVNERLPYGIRVTAWWVKPDFLSKSLASLVSAGEYEFMCEGIKDASVLLESYFAKDSITVIKYDKKKSAEKEKEIRSEMLSYRIVKNIRGRMFARVTLSANPGHTLNPFVFFEAFCRASGFVDGALIPVITRTAILNADGRLLKEILG